MKKQKEGPAHPVKNFKRLRAIYTGRVQGVGFRYTVEAIAHETGVKGWVRNLPAGDVELVVEGSEPQINDTLSRVESSALGRHIKKCKKNWLPYQNEFTEFRIEFAY